MNLVKITDKKELVVSLEDISKGTDNQINSIVDLLQRYSNQFECNIPKGSYKVLKTLCLPEKDVYKLLVIMGNNKKVVEFKFALVDEFFKMREFIKKGTIISDEFREHIERFLPKDGYLKENPKGEIKTQSVRGYYRVDKNSQYGKLLTKRYQLQKRLNSLLREDYELEIKLVENELEEIENYMR